MASKILPASTAKPSHVRIIRGELTPTKAQVFHEYLRNQ
jgi:hypothetical protein